MANPDTTDLLARLRAHSGPAIMGCTCRSALANCPACDCGHAADEIERLLEELMAAQRSAFDAGYEAAQAGKWRAGAYLDWSKSVSCSNERSLLHNTGVNQHEQVGNHPNQSDAVG